MLSHWGSLFLSMLFALLLTKIKRKLADYVFLFILVVRCMEIFLIFYLIDAKAPGLTLVDKKELADAVFFVALPGAIMTICNLKFNYLVTLPLTISCLFLVNGYAYTTEKDNMSCFLQPEGKANTMSFRQSCLICVMAVISYMYRKSTLERFTEQEKSKK